MKNHVKVNGQLLQTNKKWLHLKQSQRDWIFEAVRAEYTDYITQHGSLTLREVKNTILERIHAKITERGIWLPSGEINRHIGHMIDRLNKMNIRTNQA